MAKCGSGSSLGEAHTAAFLETSCNLLPEELLVIACHAGQARQYVCVRTLLSKCIAGRYQIPVSLAMCMSVTSSDLTKAKSIDWLD